MRSSRKNRSNSENMSCRRNVDHAKAARAKAAVKAAKSQSPKSIYKKRKLKAAVDLETPKSLLVNIRLKSVINLDTYSLLSREEKERIALLLPSCDQRKDRSGMPILNSEALNNEFFAKACVEWCQRLGGGEFVKDRQQADASWKFSHFGALNGAKSNVNGHLSTNAKLNRSNGRPPFNDSPLSRLYTTGPGRQISVKQLSNGNLESLPNRYHRHARNSRLRLLMLEDDGASVTSESSSKPSLKLNGKRLRVGSSRAGRVGDGYSRVALEKSADGGVTLCGSSEGRNFGSFVHPALRDHDYYWPLPQFGEAGDSEADCTSKRSYRSTARRRYRRKRNRKRVCSNKPVSVGIRRGKVSEMQGHGHCLPNDLLLDKSGIALKTDVDTVAYMNGSWLDGSEIDCGDETDSSPLVLSRENSLVSDSVVKSNGRTNGAYSPNRTELIDYVAVQRNHLANVAGHNYSRLKENDVNLNYVIRPCRRLKTVPHLRKCEQTDGMPLIQIQSSDWLGRLTSAKRDANLSANEHCNNGCLVVPPVCLSKTDQMLNACDGNSAFPASDSQRSRPNIDRFSTNPSNSTSLRVRDRVRPDEVQISDAGPPLDDTKFFVKFIGIQKIPFKDKTTEGKARSPNLSEVDEVDSPLEMNGARLPPSVLQEVRHYVNAGVNCPHAGQYIPSGLSQLDVEHSVRKSVHTNGVRSQEDCVNHTLIRCNYDREKYSSSQNMQDLKLNTDVRNHDACRFPDSSDCVWEAMMPENEMNYV